MYSAPSAPLPPHEMSRTTFELLLAALLQTSRPVVGPLNFLWNRYWSSFPWVQRPGSEVNHLRVSSTEVKDQWSYTTTQLVCFLGVDKENMTSTSHLPASPERWFVNLFPWTVCVEWGRCGGLTTRFHSYITVPMTELDIHLATLCVLTPISPYAACHNWRARRQAGPLFLCHA